MEYYALILNRTFVITIDGECLRGVKCRGLTSIDSGGDALARALTSKLAVHGDLDDPRSYIDEHLLCSSSAANFTVLLSDISTVEYNPKKKWGMGYYPHSSRVYISTADRTREFIILGKQSGSDVYTRLKTAVG